MILIHMPGLTTWFGDLSLTLIQALSYLWLLLRERFLPGSLGCASTHCLVLQQGNWNTNEKFARDGLRAGDLVICGVACSVNV